QQYTCHCHAPSSAAVPTRKMIVAYTPRGVAPAAPTQWGGHVATAGTISSLAQELPARGRGERMAPIIDVRNLVKRYKRAETNAVDDISFGIDPGALFALLGPNGAGKTTAISILTTTLAPTSGTVCIAGYDLQAQAAAVRREIGIIFQNPSLDLNLTAEEN